MSAFGFSILAAIVLTGIAAVVTNHRAVRRWVVAFYLLLISLSAFGFFVSGIRPAVSELEGSGGSWSEGAAAGAAAMLNVDQSRASVLFLIALFLVVLVFRQPK
jgi:hypothetical protein